MKTITIELHPNQVIETEVTQTNWIYGRGSYNTPAKLIARLVNDEEAYQTVKTREPSYQYGRLLLTLGKTDEFLKLLNKINEPNDAFWSIHRAGQFEMLSLAYGKEAGRPKDRRKAILSPQPSPSSASTCRRAKARSLRGPRRRRTFSGTAA